MQNKPIGIFDSGLGGLTTVKEIIRIMPKENIVFFGDIARVPYGNRSQETILKYTIQDINFLKSMDVKMIVAACGTISSVLVNSDIKLDLPIINVLLPTCISAINQTKNGRIGVIGTTTTIKNNSYKNTIKFIDKNIEVFQQDCPKLAPMIESQFIDNSNELLKITTQNYLSKFKNLKIDTLILGCTHYPIISDIISDVMGEGVKLINSGKSTAKFIKSTLKEKDLENNTNIDGKYEFYVSKNAEIFSHNAQVYLKREISPKLIDITSY